MTDFDVAIIGGGPAGSAAALTLLRYSSLRPIIIERSAYDEWRVGETLAPGVLPLLDYLGAREAFESLGQLQAYGTSASWGSPDVVSRAFLFTGAGDAWHLDRRRFDAALAQLVVERGGMMRTGTFVESESREDGLWRLALHDHTTITSCFVIDASGRHAAFARRQGARIEAADHLTGLVGIFDSESEDDASTLVEAVEDGWWYSARLPDARVVAALMTDADTIRSSRLHEREAWSEHLGRTQATRARLPHVRLTHDPFVCPAHSQLTIPASGNGWLAAGDAAMGVDPLSSMGIGYAIASGIQAARVAAAPTPDRLERYAADVARHFDAYLQRRNAYYAIETRWPDAPFWKRRALSARSV